MAAVICGSLAFDTIMTFEGRFADQILPDQLHILNVSFLVPGLRRDFGGCAGNIAHSLNALGGMALPMATLGINTNNIIALTFVIGAALAAVAAVLLSMQYGVINPNAGFLVGLKAFTAAVLGGIGSIPGAMLGGLVLGVAEAFGADIFGDQYKDVVAFGLLVLVLLFRPTGLLGRPEVEKV